VGASTISTFTPEGGLEKTRGEICPPPVVKIKKGGGKKKDGIPVTTAPLSREERVGGKANQRPVHTSRVF